MAHCSTANKTAFSQYESVTYVGNSKINLRLVGKKKRVVIAPKGTLSSNK